MKFGQYISYYKRKKIIKNFYKICNLKTSSRPFCACKELSTTAIGKWIFWSNLLILDMLEQNYQNLLKSACRTPQIPFYRGFLENFKNSGTSSQVTNFVDFFDKIFLLWYHINWEISLPGCVYFPNYSVKYILYFKLGHLMTSWHLNVWKVKFDYLRNKKDFQNEIKHFLFHKCSPLD